jgi:hypothetical protein
MRKKWTHSSAFKFFGVKPKNSRWSWSGRNEETHTVVHTLWQDGFRREGNTMISERTHGVVNSDDVRKPAYKEFVENMEYAQQHCNGEFRVIVAKAEDTTANPRKIKECWPKPELRMKIRSFDASTGRLVAEAPPQSAAACLRTGDLLLPHLTG